MEEEQDFEKQVWRALADLKESINASIKSLEERIVKLQESFKATSGRVDILYDAFKLVGEKRTRDCFYSRNGYCEHVTNAIADPSKVDISTVRIKGKYYPRVSWMRCYLSTKYQVPPS